MTNIKELTNWEELEKGIADMENNFQKLPDVDDLISHFSSRVKGQDEIVKDCADWLRLQLAKKNHQKPIASYLFLGPTGTGKTELAKTITEALYDDECHMIRFDCSELSSPEMAKTRLVGSPKGYVGSADGGQLTRPMLSNPRRLILFDEIEKAHPLVFDLMLQMLGDGRLTEQGSGKVADFTKCIFIMTSNAYADEIGKIMATVKDRYEAINSVKSYLADSKVFRPEIMGRIDRVYVFDSLEGVVVAEIALLKIAKIGHDYGMEIDFVDPKLLVNILKENKKISKFGIRELDRMLHDMFAGQLVELREQGHNSVQLMCQDGQVVIKPKKKAA